MGSFADTQENKVSVSWIRAGIVLSTFLMLGYPLLTKNEVLGNNVIRYIVSLLGLVMAIYVSITTEGDEELGPYFSKLRRYLAGYIPIVVFTTLWTAVFYDYSLDTILRVITPYTYIFFAYPLIFIFKRDGGPLRLLKVVALLVVGILICKAISWYCYNYSGKLVFERLLFEYEDWFRGGLQRVNAGFLIGILLAVAMCSIVDRRARILQIVILAGLVFFTLYVSAYRYQMLSVIAACVFGLFFVSHRSGIGLLQRTVIIIVIALIVTSNYSQAFFDTFSTTNSVMSQSTQIRIDNVLHYWNILTNNCSVLGLGLLTSSNSQAAAMMTYGVNHVYWLEDIGILGEFFRFGLLAFWTYGYFVYLAIASPFRILKDGDSRGTAVLVISAASYALLSCLAMNIFDGQRAFDVPFYLALFSYVYGCAQKKEPVGALSVERDFSDVCLK